MQTISGVVETNDQAIAGIVGHSYVIWNNQDWKFKNLKFFLLNIGKIYRKLSNTNIRNEKYSLLGRPTDIY